MNQRKGNWKILSQMGLAVAAASCAAPLIRLADTAPLTIALWRVLLAAAGAWMLMALKMNSHSMIRRVGAKTWLAGMFLGLHFWAWITSLEFTSVANSVLLVATQPVWAALLGRIFMKEKVPVMGLVGIGVALGGCLLTVEVTGIQLQGDLLALLGAMLAAVYLVIGRGQRKTLGLLPYVTHLYTAATCTLALLILLTGAPWTASGTGDWWILFALAAIPTGIGHSIYNKLLGDAPAYIVGTGITAETIGASLLALWWLGETPPEQTLLAAPLVLAGILLVGWSNRANPALDPAS